MESILTGIDRDILRIELKERRLAELDDALLALGEKFPLIEKACAIIRQVAEDTQTEFVRGVCSVANKALSDIFPDKSCEVDMWVDILRGIPNLHIGLRVDNVVYDPINEDAGGVVDILSFALFVSCAVMESGVGGDIIIDEPFRCLSDKYVGACGKLLVNLNESLGIRLILITHILALREVANNVVSL